MLLAAALVSLDYFWCLSVDYASKPRFAELSDIEAANELTAAIHDKFADEVGKLKIPVPRVDLLDAKGIHGHEGDQMSWVRFTDRVGGERCFLVRLDKWKQKNYSPEEILNNPNKKQSETTVEVKLWRFDPAFASLFPPGKQDLVGTAFEGYFGTTNRSEMSGSPDAKTLEIQNVDKKRMQAIADAVWDAIHANVTAL